MLSTDELIERTRMKKSKRLQMSVQYNHLDNFMPVIQTVLHNGGDVTVAMDRKPWFVGDRNVTELISSESVACL